ncbi:MAG TPA: hypothetical protein VEB70_05295 [Noviherbaspirillum sp.]|nr:hypothetical protein [Noviherbaspirillum sp.]
MNTLVTEEMLDAALRKAVEAGLLPRNACREERQEYQELVRIVLQAAFEVAPPSVKVTRQGAQPARSAISERFAEVRDMAHWLQGYAGNQGVR